jgi:ethanolamine utilization microcompartment shell protein EutS
MATPNQVEIVNTTNSVTVQNNNNQITVVNETSNIEISLIQPALNIIQVATPGPQGIAGAAGSPGTGSFATGSFATTGSNNFNGNQIITGSTTSTLGFTGSLFGTSSWANNSITSSFASNINSGLNLTASNLLVNNNINTNILNAVSASIGYVEYISGSAVIIGDQYIVLNSSGTPARFSGIQVYDSGSNTTSSIVWDSQTNHFVYENASGSTYNGGGFMSGPRNTGSLSNVIYPTQYRVLRGQGGDHLYDSNIIDNDSNVSIGINTSITGTLNVTNGITGSLLGTSSWANNSISSSFINNLNQSVVITGSTQGNVTTLTISSNTASLNLNSGNFFTLQLVAGVNTHINPSNIKPGQSSILLLSTTGSATVSFPSTVKQPSGSSYTPTTTTGTDILTFVSLDSSNLYLVNVKNLI